MIELFLRDVASKTAFEHGSGFSTDGAFKLRHIDCGLCIY